MLTRAMRMLAPWDPGLGTQDPKKGPLRGPWEGAFGSHGAHWDDSEAIPSGWPFWVDGLCVFGSGLFATMVFSIRLIYFLFLITLLVLFLFSLNNYKLHYYLMLTQIKHI